MRKVLCIVAIFACLSSCTRDWNHPLQSEVITFEATEITMTSSVLSGKILSGGGSAVTEKGFCYGMGENPTVENDTLRSGHGIGMFSVTLSGLEMNTQYYVRAFAINSIGVSYGNQIVFTTQNSTLNNGLVAHYSFSGNANDESDNANNATVEGATLAIDRHGNSNSAYFFDGQDDYLVADASNLPIADRSISLWFYTEEFDRPGILGYGGGGGRATSWFIGLDINGRKSFHMSCHYMANPIDYYYDIPPVYEWYHWVITVDKDGTRIYVNGVEKKSNSTSITNTYVTNKKLGIGVISSASGSVPYTDSNVKFFHGKIDDVLIYDRALSAEEIYAIYHENGWNQ